MWNETARSFLQLIAGLFCALFLLLGIPVTFFISSLGGWSWAAGLIGFLACLHGGLLTGQLAGTGTWIPERSNALLSFLLPPLNLCTGLLLISSSEWSWVFAAAVLLVLSIVIVLKVVSNWRRTMNHLDHTTTTTTIVGPNIQHSLMNQDLDTDAFPPVF